MRSATKNQLGKDPAYLVFIRDFPCALCQIGKQSTATEAAHVGDRGLSQKCPDRETIPLCKQHHTEGKDSIHKLGKKFWEHHDLDRDNLIERLNYIFEHWRGDVA